MAITINGKSYLSYEEQILENKKNIEEMEPLVIKHGETIPLDKVRTYVVLLKRWSDEVNVGSIKEIGGSTVCTVNVNSIITITTYSNEYQEVYIYVDGQSFNTVSTNLIFEALNDYDELRELK